MTDREYTRDEMDDALKRAMYRMRTVADCTKNFGGMGDTIHWDHELDCLTNDGGNRADDADARP